MTTSAILTPEKQPSTNLSANGTNHPEEAAENGAAAYEENKNDSNAD